MNKNIKRIALLFCAIITLLACERNEHNASYTGGSKIFFDPYLSTDSLSHSFANYPAANEKEILLPVRIMGNLENRNRTVLVEVDQQASTADATEYEIGSIAIPAGAIVGNIPLKIKNSQRLDATKVHITLKLKPSADFDVEPEKAGKLNELVKFKVVWTNILAKPSDWPSTLWGGYSKVKHRLVIDLTGQSQYSGTAWTSTGLAYQIMGVCNEWLLAYNNQHPNEPYVDEIGKQIRFCATCN